LKKVINVFLCVTLIVHILLNTSFATTDNHYNELIISEAMVDPAGSDTLYEWIEITNTSDEIINLADWKLNTKGFAEYLIQPNEIIILVRNVASFNERYPISNTKILHSFSLVNSGGTILLEKISSEYTNRFTYGQATEEKSFELLVGDCLEIRKHPTNHSAGQSNNNCVTEPEPTIVPDDEEEIIEGEYSNKVFIDIISPNPSTGKEWLEIKNIDTLTINLNNWILKDVSNKKYVITDLSLLPNATAKIYPSTISLNNDGDTIFLFAPDGRQVDIFNYPKSNKDDLWSIQKISTSTNSSNSISDKDTNQSNIISTKTDNTNNYEANLDTKSVTNNDLPKVLKIYRLEDYADRR
jgi:hypothetical protein